MIRPLRVIMPLYNEEIYFIARADTRVVLGEVAREEMARSAEVVARLVDSEEPAYGVSTGFGSLANVTIPAERRASRRRR